ncbi:MAG: saccharopine dehydrogenase-like oxidoreductase [Glaciihabitans sp.]|nr:saccharopine dehydrogenase-like oxidoreductase [Glaciihabitans sp.]
MQVAILGGYGSVGRATTVALQAAGHTVLAVGRDPERADIVLDAVNDKAGIVPMLAGLDAVVNAAGIEDVTVARIITGHGIGLVDVSSNMDYLGELENLGGAPVIVGVGLAPGISSILAAAVDEVDASITDIGIVLGAGDSHGRAAQEWTLSLLGRSFTDTETDRPVRNFSRGRKFTLPDGSRRTLLRADLSDQHEMSRDLGKPVTTSFGLDSRFATSVLAAVGRVPGSGALARRAHPSGGSDWFVAATARAGGTSISATGTGQSEATGLVAAAAVGHLPRLAPGVTSLHTVMTLDDVANLPGITVTRELGTTTRSYGRVGGVGGVRKRTGRPS